ncbi:outer membrane receptor for ferrienterochelin and colicin [Caulobacter ginsengisoli]|uniref:Outer membrane receptor for ferrienterochelin and colicin n=1 Tax=Caulobacter ginsengisoli TaxID=400775 RepID=A0ABU0IWV9_9CAUL|nr:TonB-dependent receptor [Caulobacter ginsengisoli]MDQ0466506.1 outer membrane receptor for ferrienterochelin and colicin [Caulobacter ginsengisoli]
MNRLAGGAALSVLALAMSTAVYAQETTGGVRGQITDDAGAPVAGATVTITHVPTGSVQTTMSGDNGFFSARGLRVGGPYTISATAPGHDPQQTTVASIGVGDPAEVDLLLANSGATVGELIVTASSSTKPTQGTGTNFSGSQVQALPSISRDLKDVARADPFAVVQDPDNQDALSFGGVNTRFNQLTVDGIRQNDDFGLNNNGYPTQRSPISIDAVEGVQVSIAPYSVLNNGFLGGSINAVTKSGGNNFSGSLFYEKTDAKHKGDTIRGNPVKLTFEETTKGGTFGGPIIKDKLFFFLSYDEFEGIFNLDQGPADSDKTTLIPRITTGAIDTFQAATQSVYNYDPGTWVDGAPPVSDKKFLAKVDWNITNDQRASLTYQKTEGNSFNGSTSSTFASGNSTTQPQIGLESRQYDKNELLTTYNLQVNSQWTPDFSTQLRVGWKETETSQIPLKGLDVGQTQVTVTDLPGVLAGAGTPRIQFGADTFRHDNYLDVKTTNIEFYGRYSWGANDFLAGIRTEELQVFNVFVANSIGSYTFSSYTNFLNRTAQSFTLTGAVDPTGGTVPATTGTARDGAAQFKYRLNSLYFEDTYQFSDTIRILGGLRYDWYSMDSLPTENTNFFSREGFSNRQNLDGVSILLPRIYVTWDPSDKWDLSAGFGRFSSQGLNVWISNPFANDGVRQTNAVCPAGPYLNVDLRQAPAGCTFTPGNGNVNVMDPDFKIPSVWKSTFSAAYTTDLPFLGEDWRFQFDYVYAKNKDALYWYDLRAVQAAGPNGVAPDGRPVYTRSTTGTIGANVFDMMLTNTDVGISKSAAFSVSKSWNDGYLDGLSMRLAYTNTHATDANPMTSSIADSSFVRFASSDHNHPGAATSDYEIRDRYTVTLDYHRKFFGDYETGVTLFGQRRSGTPFSYTFGNSRTGNFDNDFGNLVTQTYSGLQATSNQLLYVPAKDASGDVTLTSDPKVHYAPGFDIASFNAFLKTSGLIGYAGKIAPRNGFTVHDVTTVDIHLSQELPAFFPGGAKFQAYMDIENIGNMLNDEWGVLDQYTFYRGVPVVNVSCSGGVGTTCGGAPFYTYSGLGAGGSFSVPKPFTVTNPSLWQVKLGIRYRF